MPVSQRQKPSFVVDPDKQLWNCLGACAAAGGGKSGGDIISFVMKEEGCSFREAVGKLQPERKLTVHPEVRRKGPALLGLVIYAPEKLPGIAQRTGIHHSGNRSAGGCKVTGLAMPMAA